MILNKWIVFALAVLIFATGTGRSCTTFFLHRNGQKIFGKNYDWHLGSGMIIINQRGVFKKGLHGMGTDPVEYASWTSTYGSVTFNQYGREMPTGGMNEAGLVVHLMALYKTGYPKPDKRNPIKDLQWIQYQLDNFDTVEQVIQSNADIRILYNDVPGLHFLVADRRGNCAAIEWLNGRLVYHASETLPYKVLANNTYSDSLRYLERHQGYGGTLEIDNSRFSLDRFVRAADMLTKYRGRSAKQGIEYAFDLLRQVAQASTQWRIVYDLESREVHFKTLSNPHRRSVRLTDFDFSCRGPVKVIDIHSGTAGRITRHDFSDYTREQNEKTIIKAMTNTAFISDVPAEHIWRRIIYPETTVCDP